MRLGAEPSDRAIMAVPDIGYVLLSAPTGLPVPRVGLVTDPEAGPPKVLFICTGNYYRSRFAEILFNTLAREAHLGWIAESRGIAPERVAGSRPISLDAVRGLVSRGINTETAHRYPEKVREHDLMTARLVIGLNEIEHRWYLEENFPAWKSEVEYWHIEDVGLIPVEDALSEIEDLVRGLIVRLSG